MTKEKQMKIYFQINTLTKQDNWVLWGVTRFLSKWLPFVGLRNNRASLRWWESSAVCLNYKLFLKGHKDLFCTAPWCISPGTSQILWMLICCKLLQKWCQHMDSWVHKHTSKAPCCHFFYNCSVFAWSAHSHFDYNCTASKYDHMFMILQYFPVGISLALIWICLSEPSYLGLRSTSWSFYELNLPNIVESQKQTWIPWLSFLIWLRVFIWGSTFQRPFVNTIISAAQKNNGPSTITEAVCLRLCGRKQAKCRGLLFSPRGFCKCLPGYLAFFKVSLQSTYLWLLANKDHFQWPSAHWEGEIMEGHSMLKSVLTGSGTLQIEFIIITTLLGQSLWILLVTLSDMALKILQQLARNAAWSLQAIKATELPLTGVMSGFAICPSTSINLDFHSQFNV